MTALTTDHPTSTTAGSIRARAADANPLAPRVMTAVGKRIVQSTLARIRHGQVRIVDHAGSLIAESPANDPREPSATVRVIEPRFYAAAAFGGSLGIAEAFIDGAWETDDLAALIEILTLNMTAMRNLEGPPARLLSLLSRAAYWLERNTRAGSRRNIVAHYDLGNEFFSLFLDPTMTYSCGVFESEAATLEEAQRAKIDLACRKLHLQPSDHLLEIGTGWGALAIHAASRYGCRVTTTTISDEQHRGAEKRIREAGLEGRIRVLKVDYRDLNGLGTFDKLVSIEMIEAVGREHLDAYFRVCSGLLRADGAALIQAIVIRDQYFAAAARRRDFLKKYIFPGSCLPSVGAMLNAVRECTDLRAWHLEDIGPHYVRTLQMWRDAFRWRLDEVRRLGFDDRFIRMWEYYLGYCEGAFRARYVGDVQLLLTKPMCRIAPVGTCAAPTRSPSITS